MLELLSNIFYVIGMSSIGIACLTMCLRIMKIIKKYSTSDKIVGPFMFVGIFSLMLSMILLAFTGKFLL